MRLALRGALLIALPLSSAVADVRLTESATLQYGHDSNVFALQSGVSLPGLPAGERGDSFYGYGGDFRVEDLIERQKVFLELSGTEYHYERFSQLDHDEYKIDGGLNWKLGYELDGALEVLRNRSLVAFTYLTPQAQDSLQLPLQTEQRESAKIGFLFIPDWRLEADGYYHTLNEPLAATPNLQLAESSGQLALKYVGRAGLTAGLSASYLTGSFSGSDTAANPSYQQSTLDLVANYQATGRSTFVGAVGYSRRTSATGINSVSGVTGNFSYTGQLTGKTSVNFGLSRLINNYIANTGSEIDTIASVNLNYRMTHKTAFALGYAYTDRNLPDQGIAPATNRVDHLEYASLAIDYEARRWLAIKPFVNIQTRSSSVASGNFSDTVYGVSVIFKSINQAQR